MRAARSTDFLRSRSSTSISTHLDFSETGDDMLISMSATRPMSSGLGPRPAAHLTKLRPCRASVPGGRKRMAGSGVAATVLPATDLISARTQEFNAVRGVAPIHLMLAEGASSLATNDAQRRRRSAAARRRASELYASIVLWRHEFRDLLRSVYDPPRRR
jgi:hypothetical protein